MWPSIDRPLMMQTLVKMSLLTSQLLLFAEHRNRLQRLVIYLHFFSLHIKNSHLLHGSAHSVWLLERIVQEADKHAIKRNVFRFFGHEVLYLSLHYTPRG